MEISHMRIIQASRDLGKELTWGFENHDHVMYVHILASHNTIIAAVSAICDLGATTCAINCWAGSPMHLRSEHMHMWGLFANHSSQLSGMLQGSCFLIWYQSFQMWSCLSICILAESTTKGRQFKHAKLSHMRFRPCVELGFCRMHVSAFKASSGMA